MVYRNFTTNIKKSPELGLNFRQKVAGTHSQTQHYTNCCQNKHFKQE
jgi:hypothetical protein